MLVAMLGLPGIGKTWLLRALELAGPFVVREIDDWIAAARANGSMPNTQDSAESLLDGDPRNYAASRMRAGSALAQRHLGTLRRMATVGAYAFEFTPFLWAGVAPVLADAGVAPRALVVTVDQALHAERLAGRLPCSHSTAARLAAWLADAVRHAAVDAPVYRIDIAEQRQALCELLHTPGFWAREPAGQHSCAS
jgi:hypothetical protein